MTNRRRFTAEFKARVALEALRGDKTIQQIAAKHKVHPNQVTCAIMCQAGKGYSLWLCKSHEQEHPDVTANCDD